MHFIGGGVGHLPSIDDEGWEAETLQEVEDDVTYRVEDLMMEHEELEGDNDTGDSDNDNEGETEEAGKELEEVDSSEEFEGEEEFEY